MNNSDEPLYLTAVEAAAELSISPATLYAYVSRGLVRSEPGASKRSRRYRADDVRTLKNRRAPPAESQGLKSADLPVLDTEVSTITDVGPIYRGTAAVALSEAATIEQTATLLWGTSGSDPFSRSNLPVLSPEMTAVLQVAHRATPLERTIAVLALAASADPRAFNSVPEGRAGTGARIMRLVVATMIGTSPSADLMHRQIAHKWAPGHHEAEDTFRRAMVLLADHELNPSTFTVRCAASTYISLYDAVIAGLVALKGPRHGGAGQLASKLVDTFSSGNIAEIVREKVAQGERFAGFGHSVYLRGDARASSLLDHLTQAGADPRLTVEVPARIAEAIGVEVNIDYALAVMRRTFEMPVGSETAFFAMARTAGWIAHAMEQLASGVLIRPRARYVGPAPMRVALDRRA